MLQRAISFDTETWALEFGDKAPKLVLGSAAWWDFAKGKIEGVLLDKANVLNVFAQICDDPNAVMLGANLSQFDLLVIAKEFKALGIDVMPMIFSLFEEHHGQARPNGRVFDILTAQILDAIGDGTLGVDPRTGSPLKNPETGRRGSYSQAVVVDLVLNRQDAKVNDKYRKRYGEFDGWPLDQLPQEARDYPVDDVVNAEETGLAQVGFLPRVAHFHDFDASATCVHCKSTRVSSECRVRKPSLNLHDLSSQVYSAWCLHLGDAMGLCVDQRKVDIIEAHAMKAREKAIQPFIDAGIIRPDGSEAQCVIKRLMAIAYGCTEACATCQGSGRIPKPVQRTLRCDECKGRTQPWKGGGKINAPTVASCAKCNSTGRVPHPVIDTMSCQGPAEEVTCDGTGYFLNESVPRTDGGGISCSGDACFESGDEFVMSFGAFCEGKKILKDYVPFLRTGRLCVYCNQPGTKKYPHIQNVEGKEDCWVVRGRGLVPEKWRDVRITLASNAILASGRVSNRSYIQLLPRAPGFIDRETKQYIPSLRECFVAEGPRYQHVQVPADYVLQPGEFVVQEAA